MSQNFNKKLIIPALIVLAIVVISGIIYYQKEGKQTIGMSPQEIGEKVINFINQNVPGATASLIDIIEESGLYKITLKMEEEEFIFYVTKDGKLFFPQAIDLTVELPQQEQESKMTIGNFSVSQDTVCQEEGKPIIYFFGSTGCSHCQWEHPVVEGVAVKFGENIAFHNNMDTNADSNVFSKYSTGGVPTIVLGCKYYRVGSGERSGEEEEARNLTALICKLTGNQPSDVCEPVQDLIDQIET